MRSINFVTIVTATLNEKGNVLELVERVQKATKDVPHELIIVDDNSIDGTIDLLKRLECTDCGLRVIINDKREGLLKSNLRGLREASGDVMIVLDSDLQHPPEKIPSILEEIENGSSGVIMSRFIEESLVFRRNPLRSYATSAAIALCHTLLPPTRRYKDPISGYFGFNREVKIPYDKILELFDGRIAYKTLIPILAGNADKKFTELPFHFGKRNWGQSKIITENFFSRYLSELNSYRAILREKAY
jgi:dolichol-phosphate mannosyltransferase